MTTDTRERFDTGRPVMTRGFTGAVSDGIGAMIAAYRLIERHQRGDWGNVPAADAATNEAAIDNGERIMSSYETKYGTVWVITDAVGDDGKRASTTVLLPEEY